MVFLRLPIGDARPGAKVHSYGPDSAGSLDTSAAIATAPVHAVQGSPGFEQAAFSGRHEPLEYGGHQNTAFQAQAHQGALLEVEAYAGNYEYGSLEFGAEIEDREANQSGAPNAGTLFVNDEPAGIATSSVAVAAGVVTMTVTDKVEV